tara:strand:- start:71 stop:1672 length:1602 start_codon:yes stop_codon:yes gene_type:complete
MTIKYKQHQQKVLDFFSKNNPRGILLYHGLGSGKTITSIGVSELYKNDVVCIVPASMRTQWKKELKVVGVKNEYNIYSYEEISKMLIMNNEMKLLNNKTIIIDEAHRLRNNGTISKRIIKATKDIPRILLLTGTPMVNGPDDFSNLANLIYGETIIPNNIKGFNDKFYKIKNKKMPPIKDKCLLYSPVTCRDNGYKKDSKSKYCVYHQYMHDKKLPLKKRKEIKFNSKSLILSDEKKRIMNLRTRYKFTPKIPNIKEYSKYVECLTSYYFPDISSDYPSVTRKNIEIKMTNQQNLEYKKALNKLSKNEKNSIENGTQFTGKMSTLNAFLNLTRRISNISSKEESSPKLDKILKMCKNGPSPIIIYSNWLKSGIVPMSKLLEKNKISHFSFTGKNTDKQKKEIVRKYNKREIDVILLSSSGAEGLDLKNTRQIHIMEPHWNIAKINQVIGRGIRYKSHIALPNNERNVNVYYWISVPSISNNNKKGSDKYLYELSDTKSENMNLFLETLKKTAIENKECSKIVNGQNKMINKLK